MPAVVQHLSGAGRLVRRRLGAGDARRARHADAGRAASASPGPGKTAGRADPGGRRRRDDRDGVRDRGRARVAEIGERLGVRPARGGARQPRLPGQGLRDAHGRRRRSSSASTPSRCRRCSRSWPRADLEFLGFHVFAGSQNLHADILCEAQRKTVELAAAARRGRADAGALPQPRRRLRHPLLREGPAARPAGRSAQNLGGAAGRRGRAPACPRPGSSSSSAATSSASAACT